MQNLLKIDLVCHREKIRFLVLLFRKFGISFLYVRYIRHHLKLYQANGLCDEDFGLLI